MIAFLSASQDIVIDAYRREILPDNEQGLGGAIHVNAYKVAGMVPGALSLILADLMAWQPVFWITAAFMLPGLICTFLIAEPRVYGAPPKNMREAVVLPFREFIHRGGWGNAPKDAKAVTAAEVAAIRAATKPVGSNDVVVLRMK